jgi:hypothetical protein
MAEYDTDIGEYCRPGSGRIVAAQADRCTDAAAEALAPLFGAQDDLLPPVLCVRALTGELARRVVPTASTGYMEFLLAQMWSIAGLLDQTPQGQSYLDRDFKADLRAVFDRVPYRAPGGRAKYPRLYFGAARALDVDVREAVKDRIAWSWRFEGDYLFSETWAHARYLATYDDAQALEALAAKFETVLDGNALLALLRDLMDSPVVSAGMRRIVQRYVEDGRPTDNGIDGVPVVPVGTEVRLLLQARSATGERP